METGCDMKGPTGFWVRQTTSDGRDVTVKVLSRPLEGQAQAETERYIIAEASKY